MKTPYHDPCATRLCVSCRRPYAQAICLPLRQLPRMAESVAPGPSTPPRHATHTHLTPPPHKLVHVWHGLERRPRFASRMKPAPPSSWLRPWAMDRALAAAPAVRARDCAELHNGLVIISRRPPKVLAGSRRSHPSCWCFPRRARRMLHSQLWPRRHAI